MLTLPGSFSDGYNFTPFSSMGAFNVNHLVFVGENK